MSNKNRNINEDSEKETPVIFPIGVLLSCFATIPLIYGLTQNQISASIAGGVIILIGFVLIGIGYIQNKNN
ncbi:MAG TPA: hypothetical protein PK771_00195 [Spirochaetota bacterium]|mgnify:CR=1 FL=1|nr:hypothetical protein [Spirochaetota bacterium]